MPDLDDLFQSSIASEADRRETAPPSGVGAPAPAASDDTAPMVRPGGGAVAVEEPPRPSALPRRDAPAESEDILIDLRQLVSEWNAEHEAAAAAEAPVGDTARPTGVAASGPPSPATADPSSTGTPPRRSRLLAARHVLAEHIGAQPEAKVEPPVPVDEPDGAVSDVPAVPRVLRPADVAAIEAERVRPDPPSEVLIPPQSRQGRRRARKETDRLLRECTRQPGDGLLDEEPEVTMLGRVPATPEMLLAPSPLFAPEGAPTAPAAPAAPVAPAVDVPLAAPLEVAPTGRRARRREWRQTEKQRRAAARGQVRFPILTRSVLVWMFIFMVAGLAFGASAAFWWSQFNSEVDEIRGETSAFTQQVQGAASAVDGQRQAALDEIDGALEDARRLSEPAMAPTLAADAAPSVFLLETRDESGAMEVGSAFVIGNDTEAGTSLLLTSLDVVAASTMAPGPEIRLRQGELDLTAELWSWDPATDLALLVVETPDLPALPWASDEVAADALGGSVFTVAGLGGQGATALHGLVADQSMAGMQITAPIGTAYRGGPLLNIDGEVLGVASTALQPLGFDPGEVRFVSPIASACATVVDCGSGAPAASAEPGGEALPTEETTETAAGEGTDVASATTGD
jgi:S1-C subfamily serine protease